METKSNKKENYVEIEFLFGKDEWEREIDAAYTATAGRFAVQGFRKGKAPRGVIEKTYGKDVFIDEALKTAFTREYNVFLKANPDVKPVDYPRVTDFKADDKGVMRIKAEVDTEPEFTLGKYKGLEVKKTVIKAKNEDVDAFLKHQAAQRTRQLAASKGHKIENGDTAVIDFVGSVDGKEFEGGKGKGHNLEIGSHSFIDNFEEQLVGHTMGETVTVNVTFPQNYHAKNLAGKKSKFVVTIKNILVKHVPEMNDQFAKESSEFETLADWKKEILKTLEKEAEAKTEKQSENDLLKSIVEETKLEIPERMVEMQVDTILRDLEQRLAMQGMNLEMYAQYTGTTIDEMRDGQRENARLSVKTRLVFDAIITKENITAAPDEINTEVKRIADMSKRKPDEITKNPTQMDWIEQNIKVDKLMKFLLANNKIV